MLFFLLLTGTVSTAAAALTYVGLGALAVWMFPVLVAWYWARGRRPWSITLVAAACLAGSAGSQSTLAGIAFGAYASVGLALGIALDREWSYGKTLAVTAGSAFALLVVEMGLVWDQWAASGTGFRDMLIETVRRGATERSGADEEALVEFANQFADAWPFVMLGSAVWWLLIGAGVTVSVMRWMLHRLHPGLRFHGSFATMRPPDALVWAVILMATLWFWDHYYPHEAVRFVAWNGATALAAIYMLNGLGVFAYGVQTLKPPLFLSIAATLLLFYVPYFVMFIGLFDTWSEFRVKLDKLAEARQVRKQQDDDSWF